MDIFILALVSNQLTIPVKIDRRQQQEETSALLKKRGSMYTHVEHACAGILRSWVSWCFMKTLLLIVMSAPVRIDGRQ